MTPRPGSSAKRTSASDLLLLMAGSLCTLAIANGSASAQQPSPRTAFSETVADYRAGLRELRAEEAASDATLLGIEYLTGLEDRRRRRAARPWLRRAARYLAEAEAGRDPYATAARGEITLRAYRSELSERPQGYAIYVPPDYDPSRRYPLLVTLHGGSTNGNTFAGLTLGARIPRRDYRRRAWAPHQPRMTPQWIVVAPNGFGNSMWRYMGEQDVLDTIRHVSAHYSVDPDRVVLHGLSNGGLGSFNIGARHAWRFSAVVPLAGAPGWIHYLGGHPAAIDLRVLRPQSAWALFENARNTHFHAHHGQIDPGPMRPSYLSALGERARLLSIPFALDWYATGHDLVRPVHRLGRVFDREAPRRRVSPARVTVVTGDYRASRQHWVEVTRIGGYPAMVRVQAQRVGDGVTIHTEGEVRAITLYEQRGGDVLIDGRRLQPTAGARISLIRTGSGPWRLGRPEPEGKRPGLSGPIGDALFGRMIHVYGTGGPHPEILREAAERGATGWIDNVTTMRQTVIADTALTDTMMSTAHIVLYGDTGSNAVLARLDGRLPIHVHSEGIRVGSRWHRGRHLGVRFIYPNPLADGHYVIVQAGRAHAVSAGNRLPAFLPDWVVYDERRLPHRPGNLPTAHSRHVAAGFFDDRWGLTRPANAPAPRG